MRKLVILLIFTLLSMTFSNKCSAQYNNHKSHEHGQINEFGLGMIIGGTTISLAGFLTAPDWYYVNTTTTQINFTSPQSKNKPFFQQGPRTLEICTGITLTVTGLLTILTSSSH
jgi:hypothetical protein